MSESALTTSEPSSLATEPVRIASRKSELALVQTHWVMGQLQEHHPGLILELNTLSTQGDIILDVALAKIGDKGLFTKELEVGLLNGSSDLAVHSLKDLPTRLPEGLMLGAITRREDPLDALVVHERFRDYQLSTLPEGTVIGTSSLRRLAQLRHNFPHLQFKDVRGNLNTRLAKLDNGDYDGLILAVAGLKRLGKEDRIHQVLDPSVSLYAVGQGSLGIECRQGDGRILGLIQPLADAEATARCLAERALLRALEGGCQVPIGVHSHVQGDELHLTGMVAQLDGQRLIRDSQTGSVADAEGIGIALAHKLKQQGADEILQAIFAQARG
ncbi:hydroxymethylbilane synthase [Thermostichus vulcanus]|uniref:Porphobilinogen deaminase n=1 Tax=Thermostichus vulcanus str. 'Rupite' TaxID=2813851 RepID=A0ABT0C9I7_THEVL|nr:hydroxymethylbilane synthase [Thermostichus vulcanus]MCJ2542438.1 hydroxymethylbilane synthase [Thermostichus vulcanus str. 'Rupite']